MKCHVLSDIHLEFMPDHGEAFVDSLDPQGADTLILAGDITVVRFLQGTLSLFEQFCSKYERVIFVSGNHEAYKSSPTDVENILLSVECALKGRFIWLRTGEVREIGGRRFLGDTMWFRDHPRNRLFAHELNDFNLIRDFEPWVYDQNKRFVGFLWNNLREGDVVVTHHLPSMLSCPDEFRAGGLDGMNRFFVSDMEDLIIQRKPALWVHGHTHTATDYRIGDTRIVCNPRGYPSEARDRIKNGFRPDLFVEL